MATAKKPAPKKAAAKKAPAKKAAPVEKEVETIETREVVVDAYREYVAIDGSRFGALAGDTVTVDVRGRVLAHTPGTGTTHEFKDQGLPLRIELDKPGVYGVTRYVELDLPNGSKLGVPPFCRITFKDGVCDYEQLTHKQYAAANLKEL